MGKEIGLGAILKLTLDKQKEPIEKLRKETNQSQTSDSRILITHFGSVRVSAIAHLDSDKQTNKRTNQIQKIESKMLITYFGSVGFWLLLST